MPIRVLDAATVGRIAAGEVVERPSSVVKELMENAIDAGATAVTVEIKGGGIDYLRVTDNGCGIEPNQVRLAFENHATSKLQSADQLDDIRTLGFRGEALPSIASVSHVEMTTRVKGGETGVRLNIDGGQDLRVKEIGCPEGTTIVMRDQQRRGRLPQLRRRQAAPCGVRRVRQADRRADGGAGRQRGRNPDLRPDRRG